MFHLFHGFIWFPALVHERRLFFFELYGIMFSSGIDFVDYESLWESLSCVKEGGGKTKVLIFLGFSMIVNYIFFWVLCIVLYGNRNDYLKKKFSPWHERNRYGKFGFYQLFVVNLCISKTFLHRFYILSEWIPPSSVTNYLGQIINYLIWIAKHPIDPKNGF